MKELWDYTKGKQFHTFSEKYKASRVIQQDQGQVPSLLLEQSNKSLFPGNMFFAQWQPYQVLKSNLQEVVDTSVCHLTFDSSDPKKVQAVSFISEYNCDAGLRFDIEMYALPSLSTDQQMSLMIQHVLQSMQYLANRKYDNKLDVYMSLYFPLAVPQPLFERWISSHFDWSVSERMPFHNYMAVEYDIAKSFKYWYNAKL